VLGNELEARDEAEAEAAPPPISRAV
jgi:hypothetical protein